jgi:hypothetical protein
MLDGKRYYRVFPDEDARARGSLVSQELLAALAALEREFRPQIEKFHRRIAQSGRAAENAEPGLSGNPRKP